jgi:pyruvate-formate lyase-activating enzyme
MVRYNITDEIYADVKGMADIYRNVCNRGDAHIERIGDRVDLVID